MSDSYESELENVTVSEPGKGRKRIGKPENWKKNKKKRDVNSQNNKQPVISCQHLNKFSNARSLSNDSIKAVFDNFYSNQNKSAQDSMISSLMTFYEPKRRRSTNQLRQRELSIEYNLPNGNNLVKVYDWKTLASNILKAKQTFKISEVKRMSISPNKQIKVLMNTYSGSYTNHRILKRGQKFLPLKIVELPLKSHVKNVKLCDIKKLIANIGINESHEAFNFYKTVEEMSSFGVIESDNEEQ